MKININNIFSDAYANHKAIGNNYVLWAMYRGASPFAVILYKLGFTPNTLTTLSTLLSIAAAMVLVYEDGWIWFTGLWMCATLLDFCDGTVARMSGKVRKCAFRYDHMSDIFKIFIVFAGLGLRYDDTYLWVSILLATFSFMYFTILNHDYWSIKNSILEENSRQIEKPSSEHSIHEESKVITRSALYRNIAATYKSIRTTIMTINGHTLMLFVVFPHGEFLSIMVCTYFSFISLFHTRILINRLIKIKK